MNIIETLSSSTIKLANFTNYSKAKNVDGLKIGDVVDRHEREISDLSTVVINGGVSGNKLE